MTTLKSDLLARCFKRLQKEFDVRILNEHSFALFLTPDEPEMIMLVDSEQTDAVAICVAVNSPNAPAVAVICLTVVDTVPAVIGDPFYLDGNNKLSFGVDAYEKLTNETVGSENRILH